GEGHGQKREAESQRHADEADAQRREGGGEDGAAAAAEDEPEGTEELGGQALRHGHVLPPASRLSAAPSLDFAAPSDRGGMGLDLCGNAHAGTLNIGKLPE